MDYIFFRWVGNREMSQRQAFYFKGSAWKYSFKKLNKSNYDESFIENKLREYIKAGQIKSGLWRVQVISRKPGGKEFTSNMYFDLSSVW